MNLNTQYKLTQFSRGAGCGCKISPQVLREIISKDASLQTFNNLVVGHQTSDDAAVMDIGHHDLLISTTDFFMPIVDDAFDFGRVAAANAISDVYAMGGRPIMALAILGWPIEKIPATHAAKVLDGGRDICTAAGIPLAGGHTIDAAEPFFGLAVNGMVKKEHLKRNSGAKAGDVLFLTKPIGTGILSTAQKRGVISEDDRGALIASLTALNVIGEKLGKIPGVHAMTDVTGFGLIGHLIEMAESAHLTAEVKYTGLKKLPVSKYLEQNIIPDATYRNWNSYQNKVSFAADVPMPEAFQLLPDPQTNGGLLIAVEPAAVNEVTKLLNNENLHAFSTPVGRFIEGAGGMISVAG